MSIFRMCWYCNREIFREEETCPYCKAPGQRLYPWDKNFRAPQMVDAIYKNKDRPLRALIREVIGVEVIPPNKFGPDIKLERDSTECPYCDGDGWSFEDCYSEKGGHYTRNVPCSCPAGQKHAEADAGPDPVDDRPEPNDDQYEDFP